MTEHRLLVKVSKLAGQWALLLSAVNSSFVPREKSLALEVIPNHESNDPLLKSGFSVTCCCHLIVLARGMIIYQYKLISPNLLNRMSFLLCSMQIMLVKSERHCSQHRNNPMMFFPCYKDRGQVIYCTLIHPEQVRTMKFENPSFEAIKSLGRLNLHCALICWMAAAISKMSDLSAQLMEGALSG